MLRALEWERKAHQIGILAVEPVESSDPGLEKMTIHIQGRYRELLETIRDLSARNPLLSVSSVRLSRDEKADPDASGIAASIDAVVVRDIPKELK